jgi:hypothetical protein
MTQVRLRPVAKGLDFTRIAIAIALANGNPNRAEALAADRWGKDSLPHQVLGAGDLAEMFRQKAAVEGGATLTGNWGDALATLDGAATEFFSLVRSRSLIGRIEGFRRVPLQTRLIGLATGFSGAWVAEGMAKPVGSAVFNEESLPSRKCSALAVFSRELLEAIEPAGELLIRDDLAKALSAVIDASFADPSNAGVPDVEPASIANGVAATTSSGDGVEDIQTLVANFPGDPERAILVGSPQTFTKLHDPLLMPGLGPRGGQALGIPAIPSAAAGNALILLDPDGVALDEGEVELRTSGQATISMLDDPTQSAVSPTAVNQTSLWQANATAVLVEAAVNWTTVRPSVSVVTGVAAS